MRSFADLINAGPCDCQQDSRYGYFACLKKKQIRYCWACLKMWPKFKSGCIYSDNMQGTPQVPDVKSLLLRIHTAPIAFLGLALWRSPMDF